jgi:hypothetical protein
MEIQNYPNYLIYPDGRVWSKPRYHTKGGFLKQQFDTHGYKHVGLYKNGKPKTLKVHRLVAIHYIPNPNDYIQVDHIDRDKSNNDISNLRWVTSSENNQNIGLRKDNKSGIKNVYYKPNRDCWEYTKMINGKRLRKAFKSKPLACWCKFINQIVK